MGFGLVSDVVAQVRPNCGPAPALVDRLHDAARAGRVTGRSSRGQEGASMTDGAAPAWAGPSEPPPRRRPAEPIELVEPAAAAPIAFEDFVRSETAGLLRSAYLLT